MVYRSDAENVLLFRVIHKNRETTRKPGSVGRHINYALRDSCAALINDSIEVPLAQIVRLLLGEVWAKIHHHVKLDEDQTNKLNTAITLRLDPPLYDMTIDVKEQ